MCNPWAHESFLRYGEVFHKIADILNASGIKAQVKDNADKTGFIVKVTLPNRPVAVLREDGEHWNVNLGGKVITLNIPVQNRNAKAITAAFLKAVGK
jgi:hypothetical protein